MSESGEVDFEPIFRREWRPLVGMTLRLLGDLDRAEECAQAALVQAVERWPISGVPDRPGAWLSTTARRRALDLLRADDRDHARAPALRHQAELDAHTIDDEDADEEPHSEADQLRLVFTCCHPILAREARVALALRLLFGLSTEAVARAFVVPTATLAQRVVRAKRTLRERRIPYRVPDATELPERLPAVLEVVYLVYNTGYSLDAGASDRARAFCDEALALARLLAAAFASDAEVLGLLALMELHSARVDARANERGDLVLLEDQDRALWDRVRIERAARLIERARAASDGVAGPYLLQAEIAKCHAIAPRAEDTPWHDIASHYAALEAATGSPVVTLNRIVAVGLAGELDAALAELERLAATGRLDDYALLAATRADFLRRLARPRDAADAYRDAIANTDDETDRRYLEARLAECDAACEATSGERD